MVWNYIRSKFKTALLFMLFLFVFCLIGFLYHMPFDALVYAIILCFFFAVVLMGYSYYRFRQRQQVLEDIKARVEFGPEALPAAANAMEEEYQQIIQSLYRTASAAVSEKDRAMSDMIEYYTLWAHQIKTPIAAMRLLLQSEPATAGRDELLMELFKIEQYVEMVLQYLRLGSDSTDFVIRKCSVDKIVREAVRKYSAIFIKKKISLEYEPVQCEVITDEKWLSFVIEQILSNALKYTHEGKISIYIEEKNPESLVIADTGMGIQAEDLPRVFDKGYTGYNGRHDKKSTGIGLYLCRRIMEKLGHSLSIESEVEKGTKVKLDLHTYRGHIND